MSAPAWLLLAALGRARRAGAALADPLDPKVKYTPADQARAQGGVLEQSDLGAGVDEPRSTQAASLKAADLPALRPELLEADDHRPRRVGLRQRQRRRPDRCRRRDLEDARSRPSSTWTRC